MIAFFRRSAIRKVPHWLGVSLFLAALSFPLAASPVTVDFSFTLDGNPGSGEVTFDPTLATSDAYGPFADLGAGLLSFDFTYGGNNYNISGSADYPFAPEVFLPGNDYENTIGPGQIGLFGYWAVPGSESGGFSSLIGFGRSGHVALLTGVEDSSVLFTGSGSDLTLGVCPLPLSGSCPNFTEATAAIVTTPEPAYFPVLGLGLAAFCVIRRRQVVLP